MNPFKKYPLNKNKMKTKTQYILVALVGLAIGAGVYFYQESKVNALKDEILGVNEALEQSYIPTQVEELQIQLSQNRIARENKQMEIDYLLEQVDYLVNAKKILSQEADEIKQEIIEVMGL